MEDATCGIPDSTHSGISSPTSVKDWEDHPQICPQAMGNSSGEASLRWLQVVPSWELKWTRTEQVDSWSLFQIIDTVAHISRTGKKKKNLPCSNPLQTPQLIT